MLRFRTSVNEEATTTAAIDVTPTVTHNSVIARRKWKDFEVPTEVFSKFSKGRMKYERWCKMLDLNDDCQKQIYDYARKNRDAVVVLKDSTTGALRSIRRRASNE
jgi:hypothetical protein